MTQISYLLFLKMLEEMDAEQTAFGSGNGGAKCPPIFDIVKVGDEGDGSSLRKARKFGPQYRNDFPDLLARWPTRAAEPEKTEHAEPEDILAAVAEKERRL